MAIVATAGDSKTYDPPSEGTHQAVCVDVIDLGYLPNTFKPGTTQHKILVVWQIDETRDDGTRYLLFKRYTLSLNEKANLRHDLESWRGKAFTRDEEMGFDVESVKGANCLLSVQHKAGAQGKVYANVVSVMPLLKSMAKIAAVGYTRPESFAQTAPEQPEPERESSDEVDADQIPF